MPRKPPSWVLPPRLARSLRQERVKKGWTQEQAAEACGLNVRHYQKLEEGTVNTTLRTLEKVGRAFEVDPSQLLSV